MQMFALQATFIFSIVKYTPLRFSDTYVYPLWANILGWFIATISLSLIPLFVLYKMARGEGTLQQVSPILNKRQTLQVHIWMILQCGSFLHIHVGIVDSGAVSWPVKTTWVRSYSLKCSIAQWNDISMYLLCSHMQMRWGPLWFQVCLYSFEINSNNRLEPAIPDITVRNFWKLIYIHIQVTAWLV